MTRRVLCEGPEDISALREIAKRYFQAESITSPTSGAGQERTAMLRTVEGQLVRITAGTGGKSSLPANVATLLAGLPPQQGQRGDDRTASVSVIFDPDDDRASTFYSDVDSTVLRDAPTWQLKEITPGRFRASRGAAERVLIRLIHWRADNTVLNGLPDVQDLDRLLCQIAGSAYPADETLVRGWLAQIAQRPGRAPKWKAAVHLWCALIEERATEVSAAARFLGQNAQCAAKAPNVLAQLSLWRDLRRIFAGAST